MTQATQNETTQDETTQNETTVTPQTPQVQIVSLYRATLIKDKNRNLFITVNGTDIDIPSKFYDYFTFNKVREFSYIKSGRSSHSDELELYKESLKTKLIHDMRSMTFYYRNLEYSDLTKAEQYVAKMSSTLGAGTAYSTDFFVERVATTSKEVPEIKAKSKRDYENQLRAAKARGGKAPRKLSQEQKDAIGAFHKGRPKPISPGRTKGSLNSKPRKTKKLSHRIVVIDLIGNVLARHLRGTIYETLAELKISRTKWETFKRSQKEFGIRDIPMYSDVVTWINFNIISKHLHKGGWRMFRLDHFIEITGINPYDDYTDSELELNMRVKLPVDKESAEYLSKMGREPARKVSDGPQPLIYD